MNDVIRIGMDTSKSVFVLRGVDAAERPVLRRKLRRRQLAEFLAKLPATRIGIEACGAAHHWGRELSRLGHEVKLLAPQLVKPYVARNKNDGRDAEAICEAMSRPRMRFVPVKSAEQQAALMLAGVRDQLVGRRTQLSNTIRGYAAEFGLVAAKGLDKIEPLLARIAGDAMLPALAKELFARLGEDYAETQIKLRKTEAQLMAWHRQSEVSRRLAQVPGVGPIAASLLVMKVPDPKAFRCGRDFAAWLGLTPKDHSTAGKTRLGVITRAGDEALRRVLVVGATAVIQQARRGRTAPSPWLAGLIKRKPPKLAAVALANKTARIAWKLMVSGERYDGAIATRGRPDDTRPERKASRRARHGQGRCAPPAAVAGGQP
jgi:transposase